MSGSLGQATRIVSGRNMGPGVLTEEPFKYFIATACEVCRDIGKDGGQSSNAEWGM